jgi:hypothetical protein
MITKAKSSWWSLFRGVPQFCKKGWPNIFWRRVKDRLTRWWMIMIKTSQLREQRREYQDRLQVRRFSGTRLFYSPATVWSPLRSTCAWVRQTVLTFWPPPIAHPASLPRRHYSFDHTPPRQGHEEEAAPRHIYGSSGKAKVYISQTNNHPHERGLYFHLYGTLFRVTRSYQSLDWCLNLILFSRIKLYRFFCSTTRWFSSKPLFFTWL